jgi:glycolate oxidase iron-sulfur subunit
MLLLDGCVQQAAAPQINTASIQVFDRLGIRLDVVAESGCCGALQFHLSDIQGARQRARTNIDAWWPAIEQGVEAIVITASGCAPMVKDYGHLLKDDPRYANRAQQVSALARDLSEILTNENLSTFRKTRAKRISFHSPCTLQHGQGLNGVVESVLQDVGYELTPVRDAHLCCGSAGTYSILQPGISSRLLQNKLQALQEHQPAVIATGNIGCLLHLQTRADVPVIHWIELLED